jgi:hypothetical protein
MRSTNPLSMWDVPRPASPRPGQAESEEAERDESRATMSESSESSESSHSEPIRPLPAGHPGIGLLIKRARRRRSRETAELLAGVDLHRGSTERRR